MAQYQQGTITLTAGETTVSGFGTAWLANAKAGDMLLVGDNGPAAFVGSVVSDTELVLEQAWLGADAVGATYAIHRDFDPTTGAPLLAPGDTAAHIVINRAVTRLSQQTSGAIASSQTVQQAVAARAGAEAAAAVATAARDEAVAATATATLAATSTGADATAAEASAQFAGTQSAVAVNAAADAVAAQNLAQAWAVTPEDTPVTPDSGSYSALHWAKKAANSAAAAAEIVSGNSFGVVGDGSTAQFNAGSPGATLNLVAGAGVQLDFNADARSVSIAGSDSTVIPGSYGSATQAPTFTVDAKGRLTAADNVTLAPGWSTISDKPTTLSGYGISDAMPISGGTFTGAVQSSAFTIVPVEIAGVGTATLTVATGTLVFSNSQTLSPGDVVGLNISGTVSYRRILSGSGDTYKISYQNGNSSTIATVASFIIYKNSNMANGTGWAPGASRLGFDTATSRLFIGGESAMSTTTQASGLFVGADGIAPRLEIASANNANIGSSITLSRHRGIATEPSAVVEEDAIGTLNWSGWVPGTVSSLAPRSFFSITVNSKLYNGYYSSSARFVSLDGLGKSFAPISVINGNIAFQAGQDAFGNDGEFAISAPVGGVLNKIFSMKHEGTILRTNNFNIANLDPSASCYFKVNHYGNVGTSAYLTLASGRGTQGAPQYPQSADTLGQIDFSGFAENAGYELRGASIQAIAAENWSPTVRNTHLAFSTVSGTTTNEGIRLTSDGKLGIGTKTPQTKLQVQNATENIPGSSSVPNTTFHPDMTSIVAAGQASRVASVAIGSGRGGFEMFRAAGTFTAPAYLTNSTSVGNISWLGWEQTFGDWSTVSQIVSRTAKDWSPSARDTQLEFWTTNGTEIKERLRISNTGNVGIGTPAPQSSLHVSKGAETIPGSSPAGLPLHPDTASVILSGNSGARFATYAAGASSGGLYMSYAGNSLSSPAFPSANASLGSIVWSGWSENGSNWSTGANINVRADTDWSPSSRTTRMEFRVSDDAGSVKERLRINPNGSISNGALAVKLFNPSGHLTPRPYTVSQLSAITPTDAGEIVYVTDAAGGSVPAFWNGTFWARVSDLSNVTGAPAAAAATGGGDSLVQVVTVSTPVTEIVFDYMQANPGRYYIEFDNVLGPDIRLGMQYYCNGAWITGNAYEFKVSMLYIGNPNHPFDQNDSTQGLRIQMMVNDEHQPDDPRYGRIDFHANSAAGVHGRYPASWTIYTHASYESRGFGSCNSDPGSASPIEKIRLISFGNASITAGSFRLYKKQTSL